METLLQVMILIGFMIISAIIFGILYLRFLLIKNKTEIKNIRLLVTPNNSEKHAIPPCGHVKEYPDLSGPVSEEVIDKDFNDTKRLNMYSDEIPSLSETYELIEKLRVVLKTAGMDWDSNEFIEELGI